jgi:riboflavin kinase / FMN adenylyltransferase
MLHYTNLTNISTEDTWLTIGSFDGVHRGHQFLISNLVSEAHQAGNQAMVLTFHPHPAQILRGLNTPYFLTSLEEKLELLDSLHLDGVITLEFTHAMAASSAEDFMQMLTGAVHLRRLRVGQGFALGHERKGNVDYLRVLGKQLGYSVDTVTPYELDGKKLSSSLIRSLIREGRVEQAGIFLGRPYSVQGLVVPGDGRGKSLGFPTANVQPDPLRLLPERGVYACRVTVDNRTYPSVANIGLRPTFEGGSNESRLEAHLMDYSGDLYKRNIRVEFIQRLREEKKFNTVQELMDQVQADIKHGREVLS